MIPDEKEKDRLLLFEALRMLRDLYKSNVIEDDDTDREVFEFLKKSGFRVIPKIRDMENIENGHRADESEELSKQRCKLCGVRRWVLSGTENYYELTDEWKQPCKKEIKNNVNSNSLEIQ